jgi:hypothetical protein
MPVDPPVRAWLLSVTSPVRRQPPLVRAEYRLVWKSTRPSEGVPYLRTTHLDISTIIAAQESNPAKGRNIESKLLDQALLIPNDLDQFLPARRFQIPHANAEAGG